MIMSGLARKKNTSLKQTASCQLETWPNGQATDVTVMQQTENPLSGSGSNRSQKRITGLCLQFRHKLSRNVFDAGRAI